jgi:uncharacterized protein (TIGR00255 family)
MVASMTGFGRGEHECDGSWASVEVKSVNGRYAEVSVHLPRSLAELEPRIKEVVLSKIARGHVTVSISLKGEGADRGIPTLNQAIVEAYKKGLGQLATSLGVENKSDPLKVAVLPNVFEFEAAVPDLDATWSAVGPACELAVGQCQAMRLSEGEKLARDFVARIETLENLVDKVEEKAPERVASIRQKLEEKLEELLSPGQIDQSRLLMEVTLLAERNDVTEEFIRFHSHNGQFLKTLEREDAIGRRLNFLLQEMLREANTIGSKANDAEIAHLVVEMKEEIEKLKEQVQNIE